MSSYAPLPRKPPPLSYAERDRDRYTMNHQRFDERPRHPRDTYRPPAYQFRGMPDPPDRDARRDTRGDDSYRPHRPARQDWSEPRRSTYDYPPDGHHPSNDARPRSPPYRQHHLQSPHAARAPDFTFRHAAPPGVDPTLDDRFRRRSPPHGPSASQFSHNGRREDQFRGAPRGPGRGRGRGGVRLAADRAFLRTNREPTPEMMPGMNDGAGISATYMPTADASDSDEEDMSMSEDDASGGPARKHRRTAQKPDDGNDVPQWSNPDPYTALPPPDDSLRKKKDVVKLIRKSRISGGESVVAKAQAAQDDFISFNFDDDAFGIDDQVPVSLQTDPKGTTHTSDPSSRAINGHNDAYLPQDKHVPPKPSTIGFDGLDKPSDPNLGSRKRTIRDEIVVPPSIYGKAKDGPIPKASGSVLPQWRVRPGMPKAPWSTRDHSDTPNMGFWLHKEILDWYDFVKPRNFERYIRTKLVEDLSNRVRRYFLDADIYSFGSFPADLFLPVSDMDLVFMSDRYHQGGQAKYAEAYRRFGTFLANEKLAIKGSVVVISKARVPLVKYVDATTGLRVDVSFENDSGLVANRTFQAWKVQFPAMPILVTLLKHLLAMRGLNEPMNGGIGGFAVTCLVVSLLQHIPQVQSGSMVPEHHLGEILMEFLDLYGNEFDFITTGIRVNPPSYFSKSTTKGIAYGTMTRICIMDPNKPENVITGGSSNTATILRCFSDCYYDLQSRMSCLYRDADRREASILEVILAADYTSFKLQRDHLALVHQKLFGPIRD